FFQAEDGIRDYKVTGVQTCALPISPCEWSSAASSPARGGRSCRSSGRARGARWTTSAKLARDATPWCPSSSRARGARELKWTTRSEERRVGKEGWWRVVAEWDRRQM